MFEMRISNFGLRTWILLGLSFTVILPLVRAQESPSASESTTAMPSASAVEAPSPDASSTLTPADSRPASVRPSGAKSIRISFLPPPLEGTISLGIYDEWNKLVRVLHQESEMDEFVIGDDALSTKWDGRDDDGFDVAPGRYQARGFAVGKIKKEPQPAAPASPPPVNAVPVKIELMQNPLGKDEPGSVELSVGFDDENSYLKTADGLPLYTISSKSNVQRAGMAKAGDRSADVWQDTGGVVEHFRLSNLDRMMAFDCGEFEVK